MSVADEVISKSAEMFRRDKVDLCGEDPAVFARSYEHVLALFISDGMAPFAALHMLEFMTTLTNERYCHACTLAGMTPRYSWSRLVKLNPLEIDP